MENSRNFLAKWFAIVASALLGVIVATDHLDRLLGEREIINVIIPSCILGVALVVFLIKWKKVRWQQPLAIYGALVMAPFLILYWVFEWNHLPSNWVRTVATISTIAFAALGTWNIWRNGKENRPILPIITLVATAILYIIFFPSSSFGISEIILARHIILILSYLALAYFAYRLIMNRAGKISFDGEDKFITTVGLSYSVLALLLTYIFVSPMDIGRISLLIRLVLLLTISIGYNVYVYRKKSNSPKILNSAAIISSLSLFQLFATSIYDLDPLYLFGITVIAWIHYCRLTYNMTERFRNNPQLIIRASLITIAAIIVLVLIIRTALIITDAQSEGLAVSGYRTMIVVAAIIFAISLAFAILAALNQITISGGREKKIAKYASLAAGVIFVFCLSISNITLRVQHNALVSESKAKTIENANSPRGRKGNYTFHHAQDVYNYLYGKTFVSGGYSISFSGSGMYVNGQCWTGAISVTNFSATRATCTAVSPYGGNITITVDCQNGYVINQGDIYYEQ